MGKSGGEHVGPVPNCAAAFVYEFQFLKNTNKRDPIHESIAFVRGWEGLAVTHLAFFAGEEIVKDETRRLQAPCSHLPA